MTDIPPDLPDRIAAALATADLDAFRELLAPDAHWGAPDSPKWGCQNRNEIIAWYSRSRDEGTRGDVFEVVPGFGAVLVGMRVHGNQAAEEAGGAFERWQVLTVRDGQVTDIAGYEDRAAAAARAGVTQVSKAATTQSAPPPRSG